METLKPQIVLKNVFNDHFYTSSTFDVEIRVRPEYLPRHSRPDQSMYTWSYMVTIENQGSLRLQLLNRHWIITDGRGRVEHVKGNGVIGEQPILLPSTSFSYTSGCPLKTPTGNMRGWYELIDLDSGKKFKARIPLFFLRSDLITVH